MLTYIILYLSLCFISNVISIFLKTDKTWEIYLAVFNIVFIFYFISSLIVLTKLLDNRYMDLVYDIIKYGVFIVLIIGIYKLSKYVKD